MSAVGGPGAHIAALDAFVEVLSTVPDGPAPDDADGSLFYSQLCRVICDLTSAERAVIFRYDAARRQVRAAGAHGVDAEIFDGGFFTVESLEAARTALEEDRVVETETATIVPPDYVDLVADVGLIVTPMAAGGQWVGVIISDRPAGSPGLSEPDRHTLWTLGKTAALAATARSATAQSQRARELEERIDMARDLHDGVVQRLFGVSLALSGEGPLDAESRVRAADELQQAMHDLREALSKPLGRAPRPTQVTLADELTRLAAGHADLGVVLEEGDPTSVPPELEPLVQSVLAEAVRNAHKHAEPTAVRVRIRDEQEAFVLEVRNDGARAGRGSSGVGLRLAAVEALHQGALLEFGSPAPGEWQVRLVIPRDA